MLWSWDVEQKHLGRPRGTSVGCSMRLTTLVQKHPRGVLALGLQTHYRLMRACFAELEAKEFGSCDCRRGFLFLLIFLNLSLRGKYQACKFPSEFLPQPPDGRTTGVLF